MADPVPEVGDLVRLRAPFSDEPRGPALVLNVDKGGWYRVRWLQPPESLYLPDGYDRWYPASKIIVISKGYKKDEESFKKTT